MCSTTWKTMALVGVVLSLPHIVSAQPILRVRAETRIEVEVHEGVLTGVLVDDAGAGLAGESLRLVITSNGNRRRMEVQTDGDGNFEGVLDVDLPSDVQAVFDGNEHFQRSEATRRMEEVPLTLSFADGATSMDLDDVLHVVEMNLEGPFSEEHTLKLRNELGHELGEARPGARTRFEIASPNLGPIGAGSLRATLEDGVGRIVAEAELRIVRLRQPVCSLEQNTAYEGPGIYVEGVLSDSAGPMRRRAISILVDGARSATVLTEADGRFAWSGDLDSGAHTLEARFLSDQIGHPSASSEVLHIELSGNWLAELWFLAPFAFFALFAAWLVRRRPAPVAPGLEPVVRGVSLRLPPPGQARQSGEIGGRLMDLVDGGAKPGSVRAVSEAGESREMEIPPSGVFHFDLEAGKWRLVFGSPGHAPEIIDLRCPHDGRYLQMSVRLENWRHRAVRILRRVAQGVLGRRDLSATTVHQLRQEPKIADLAGDVEVLAYGPGARDGAAIGALEEKADQIPSQDDGTR